MRRGRSTGTPTKAQQERFEAIRSVGCVSCLRLGIRSACEIHHLTIGGRHGQKRRGHDFTIGLCPWHHRGDPSGVWSTEALGPSYAREPRRFREEFGCDDFLLGYQNELIGYKPVEG